MPVNPPPWRQRLIALILMSAAWCAFLVFQPGTPVPPVHSSGLGSYTGEYHRAPRPVIPTPSRTAGRPATEALRPRQHWKRHRHRYLAPPPSPVTAAPLEPAQPAAVPVGQVQAYAESLVGRAQFACVDAIFIRESGWRWNAYNPSGAYGIPQALPGSKMASAGADWQTNPLTQVRWGIGYMDSTYGSPCGAWAFWQAHGYY